MSLDIDIGFLEKPKGLEGLLRKNRYELVIKAKEGILQKTLFSICYGDDDVGYGKLYSKEEIRLDNSLATLVKALFDKAIKHEN